MDTLPKELEETQLSLQVIVDPKAKFITMKTHTDDIAGHSNVITMEIIPNDPLNQPEEDELDIEKMSELERLIYTERQRLLNLKKFVASKKSKTDYSSYFADVVGPGSYQQLSQKEKTKLRMRKFRERMMKEDGELRRYRDRILTMKVRLMQKLRNFEDETILKDKLKRDTARIKQKRLERIANETAEQRALRKRRVNTKKRLATIRSNAFKTPEELVADREKRLAYYMEKCRTRRTKGKLKDFQSVAKEKAKERRKVASKEWKKVQMAIKGVEMKAGCLENL